MLFVLKKCYVWSSIFRELYRALTLPGITGHYQALTLLKYNATLCFTSWVINIIIWWYCGRQLCKIYHDLLWCLEIMSVEGSNQETPGSLGYHLAIGLNDDVNLKPKRTMTALFSFIDHFCPGPSYWKFDPLGWWGNDWTIILSWRYWHSNKNVKIHRLNYRF